MSRTSEIDSGWMKTYLRAALEVDVMKLPWRIDAAREAVAERLKDLEGNPDHHTERHETELALVALDHIQDETRTWKTFG